MTQKIWLVAVLGLAVLTTGCFKKKEEPVNLASGAGFDSLSPTEELAQLPQASAVNQQSAIESLPIETAPVTQTPVATAPETTAPAQTSISMSDPDFAKKVQTALQNAGLYTGNIDGKIGPRTKKAIETFQTNNGLKADGKVGPKTWAKLEPYLNSAPAGSATADTTVS